MITKMLYILGFSLLLLSKTYAVYRNDTDFLNVVGRDPRRIRNKYVTFETTDTDIELAFQFNVPFIAMPTDRSLNNIRNSVTSFVNLNVGSVALASIMIVFGSVTSFLWSMMLPNSNRAVTPPNNGTNTTAPDDNTTNIDEDTTNVDDSTTNTDDSTTSTDPSSSTTTEKIPKSERANEDTAFMKLMNFIEKMVQTTINPSVCIQKYICSLSKSTAQSVAGGCGTSTDKIIDGIFGTSWILDVISGTAIADAIRFGESTDDCHKKYSECGFGNVNSEELFKMFKRSISLITF